MTATSHHQDPQGLRRRRVHPLGERAHLPAARRGGRHSTPTSRSAPARTCATPSRRPPRRGPAGPSARPTTARRSSTALGEMLEARSGRDGGRDRPGRRGRGGRGPGGRRRGRPADLLRRLGRQVRAGARQREPGGRAVLQFHGHRAHGDRRGHRAPRGAAARAPLARGARDHERQHGGGARLGNAALSGDRARGDAGDQRPAGRGRQSADGPAPGAAADLRHPRPPAGDQRGGRRRGAPHPRPGRGRERQAHVFPEGRGTAGLVRRRSAQSLYSIRPLLEFKTTWHPIGA